MSDVANNSTNSTATTNTEFKIGDLVVEKEKFNQVAAEVFTTSNQFCESVSTLLKSVYADYEGCRWEMTKFNNGESVPTITLFFNHREGETTLPYACSKEEEVLAENSTLRKTRLLDYRLKNGDRYYLTEKGKKGIGELIYPANELFTRTKDGKREPAWNKITQEMADTTFYMDGRVPSQYTAVKFINPDKLAEIIYGSKDEDDNEWIYGVRVMRGLPQSAIFSGAQIISNYAIAIERVSVNVVNELANQFGLTANTGINIIR